MKLDLGPVRSSYVAPTFGTDVMEPLDPALQQRLRRPMVVGAAIIGVLVVGLGLWAALTPLASGITAPGEVKVEANLKTIRHREGGTVRQILVQEGQFVKANQPLITFEDTDTKAAYDVLQNQSDILNAQAARASAEASGQNVIQWPADLTARAAADSRVAGLMRDQQFLFDTRLQLFQSQSSVLTQRMDQIQNQIQGDQAQVDSVKDQSKLTDDEMSGYKTLYAKGYAPRQLILRYQRSMSELAGKQGSLVADIARLKQQQGETRMQMAAMRDQRHTTAADELREAQAKLADVGPRLTAARVAQDATVVRSPAAGYIFNLTQFTQGGASAPGEVLMQVVPANSPLFVQAMIKPQDVETVHVGMKARVRILALNPRWHHPMDATVVMLAADKTTNEKSGQSFYRADVRIDPKELTKLKKDERITPGMPASVMLISGKRTLLGFLVSPITDTMEHAFREQ
ncbi:MAG TPA: HlyD family type I secretion periplasmic adaptor subunit [Phenylobacterium sp.]|uniref:HlyD family type I secretion periplasmic adaptor subunit n=1 Tax=Phenylobacterium sp. TaxID=1871053 RepID=UPI002B485668|nr:HlyD family type I secretion periplasmic adaptor subunit [Phenylobacterium sp.]HKR87630.1 HlyD family type I secretion periplasmic adaptor subunit [Phenylobacterium sp.]